CGRGVQSIDGVVELCAEILLEVKRASDLNQCLREIGIDPPVAYLVGVGEGVARNASSNAHVVELAALRPQADLDIAQTLPVSHLCKGHAQKLIQAAERFELALPFVTLHAPTECVHRHVTDHLREDKLSRIHRSTPSLCALRREAHGNGPAGSSR